MSFSVCYTKYQCQHWPRHSSITHTLSIILWKATMKLLAHVCLMCSTHAQLCFSRESSETEMVYWWVISCNCVTWVLPLPRPFRKIAVGPESIYSYKGEPEHRLCPKVNIGPIFHISCEHFDTKMVFCKTHKSGEKIYFETCLCLRNKILRDLEISSKHIKLTDKKQAEK